MTTKATKRKQEEDFNNMNVRIDDDMKAALDQAVEKMGEKLSTVVRIYLRDRLKAEGFLK
jgi:antitoxin component of RelBE/YafQ-DinJ toxin-antitoxin module